MDFYQVTLSSFFGCHSLSPKNRLPSLEAASAHSLGWVNPAAHSYRLQMVAEQKRTPISRASSYPQIKEIPRQKPGHQDALGSPPMCLASLVTVSPEQQAGRSLSKGSPHPIRNSGIATLRGELPGRALSFLRCERNGELQGGANSDHRFPPRGPRAPAWLFLTPKCSSPYGSCPSYQASLSSSRKPSWIHQVQLPSQ